MNEGAALPIALVEARRGQHDCIGASPAVELWSRPPTRVVAVVSTSGPALSVRYPVVRAQFVCALLASFGARVPLFVLIDDTPPRGVALSPRTAEQARALWSERWIDDTLLLSAFEQEARAVCAARVRDGTIIESARSLQWSEPALSAVMARWERADRNALRSVGVGAFVATPDLRTLSAGVRIATAVLSLSGERERTLVFCGAPRTSAAGLSVACACEILAPSAPIEWIGSLLAPAAIDPESTARLRAAALPVLDLELDQSLIERFGQDALWLAIAAWRRDEPLTLAAERDPAIDALESETLALASRALAQFDQLFASRITGAADGEAHATRAAHARALEQVFEPLLDRFDLGETLRRMCAWMDRVRRATVDRPVISPPPHWRALIERTLRPWSRA